MVELELSDLIKRAQNRDEVSIEILLKAFKPKVTAISREYFLVGADTDDLIQEGMIGLYKAVNIYDDNKNKNFSAFASLCIHRQLQNAVKNANRMKNAPLNKYLSIDSYGTVDSENEEHVKLLIVDDESDIEKDFLDKELNAIVLSKVKNLLDNEQFRLLKMFLNGASYVHMSNEMRLTKKQVDNMLQSIKKKIRAIKGEI